MAGLLPKQDLKDSYVRFIKKLDFSRIPNSKEVIAEYYGEDKLNQITNNNQGKITICHYIQEIFCTFPKLMTPQNKELIEAYSQEIDLEALFQPSPSPKKHLPGG